MLVPNRNLSRIKNTHSIAGLALVQIMLAIALASGVSIGVVGYYNHTADIQEEKLVTHQVLKDTEQSKQASFVGISKSNDVVVDGIQLSTSNGNTVLSSMTQSQCNELSANLALHGEVNSSCLNGGTNNTIQFSVNRIILATENNLALASGTADAGATNMVNDPSLAGTALVGPASLSVGSPSGTFSDIGNPDGGTSGSLNNGSNGTVVSGGTVTTPSQGTPPVYTGNATMSCNWRLTNSAVFATQSLGTRPTPCGADQMSVANQTGTRTFSCPNPTAAANPVGTDTWSGGSCAWLCHPAASQTQNVGCPSGYTGTIAEQRDSSCPAPTGNPVYGAWYQTSSTCALTCNSRLGTGSYVPTALPSKPANCPAGQQSTSNQTGTRTWTCGGSGGLAVNPSPIDTYVGGSCGVTCVPAAQQIQNIGCPPNQVGGQWQYRDSYCPSPTGSPAWGAWTTYSNTCALNTSCVGYPAGYAWNGASCQITCISNATYDAWSKVKGWTWNSGRQASFTQDLDGKVSTMSYGLTTQTYGFDDALKISSISQINPAFSLTYGYDNRDRLTSSNIWGSYTYDKNSNRTGYLGALGPITYDISLISNQNIAINSNPLTFDLSGNILTKSGETFTYDDWRRMRSVVNGGTMTSYGVDGLGERVTKQIGGNKFYYIYSSIGHLIGVYDASGNPMDETIYLGSRPIASLRGTGVNDIYPIESDHSETPIRVLDSTDAVVWSWEAKEPFGMSQPSGTFSFNLRFPGQWYDAESGLMSNGYRDYDPVSGRYMETDPLGLEGGMNIYGYVGASPLMGVDPEGLIIVTKSPEAQRMVQDAINYLGQSNLAKEIITRLSNSPITVTIKLTDNFDDHSDSYNRINRVLRWNPHEALATTNGGYLSPALGLMHEFGHADINVFREIFYSVYELQQYDRRAIMDNGWDTYEEYRDITQVENKVASDLHEGVRNNHDGVPYYVCNSTSIYRCK